MLRIQPDWYYIGFWRVSMPGLGLDYVAIAFKAAADKNDPTQPFSSYFRFRLADGQEKWQEAIAVNNETEEQVIAIYDQTCDNLRKEAGGGEYFFVPIFADGVTALEVLLKQDWITLYEAPQLILPEEPDLLKITEQAKLAVEKFYD